MIQKIITTFGLGVLGIDPVTAVYLMAMALRKEKKSKISLFFLSFAGFSVLVGAALSTIFGVATIDFLKNMIPGDDSPFWAVLKLAIAIFILVWTTGKLLRKSKPREEPHKEIGGYWSCIITGFLFAISSFTDPTFYAVILMGGDSENFLTAALLLALWFLVSQFMAVIIYVANEVNLLDKLLALLEKLKQKNMKVVSYVLYAILFIIAIALLIDAGCYLLSGKYLF